MVGSGSTLTAADMVFNDNAMKNCQLICAVPPGRMPIVAPVDTNSMSRRFVAPVEFSRLPIGTVVADLDACVTNGLYKALDVLIFVQSIGVDAKDWMVKAPRLIRPPGGQDFCEVGSHMVRHGYSHIRCAGCRDTACSACTSPLTRHQASHLQSYKGICRALRC